MTTRPSPQPPLAAPTDLGELPYIGDPIHVEGTVLDDALAVLDALARALDPYHSDDLVATYRLRAHARRVMADLDAAIADAREADWTESAGESCRQVLAGLAAQAAWTARGGLR